MSMTRRDFFRTTAASTLLAGVPARWAGAAYASDAPETPKMRIGIIALTDCSSIVMAHELGLFKKYGIESTVSKEASWAVIRDRLSLGENQATHMLLGIPYAATMGLQGSPVKPMIIPMYLNRNGQAITLTKALLDKGVKTPQQLKPLVMEAKTKGAPMTFAMTYPPGTHAMWIRYWLASGGINPDKDVSLITIPPPQMVANKNPRTVKAVMRAVLEASQWIDKLENRPKMAEVVSQPQYINTTKEVILGRLLGDYDYGDGRKEKDKLYMTFFDRYTNFPLKSHGVWWLSQFRRWGMVKEAPDYKGIVDRVHRPDIYREVAKELGVEAPREDMKKETFWDGVAFDPADPEKYAKSFPIHSMA